MIRIECTTADITLTNIAAVLRDASQADFSRYTSRSVPFYSSTLRAPAWVMFEESETAEAHEEILAGLANERPHSRLRTAEGRPVQWTYDGHGRMA